MSGQEVDQKPTRILAVFVEVHTEIGFERSDDSLPLLLVLVALPENHLELGPQAILREQHGVELLVLRLAAALVFAANGEDQNIVGSLDERLGERVATLGIATHERHDGQRSGLQRSLFGGLDRRLLGHRQIEAALLGDVGEHSLANYLPQVNVANPPFCEVFSFLNFSKRRPNLF